jgi:hypothetical protein
VGIFAGTEVHWPVNEVQVEVLELELGEGVVEGRLDVGGVVLSVPQLRGDEDVLTLEAWDVLEGTLERGCDLFLILVADWWNYLLARC